MGLKVACQLETRQSYGFSNFLLHLMITHFYLSPNGRSTGNSGGTTLHQSSHLATGGDSLAIMGWCFKNPYSPVMHVENLLQVFLNLSGGVCFFKGLYLIIIPTALSNNGIDVMLTTVLLSNADGRMNNTPEYTAGKVWLFWWHTIRQFQI